MGEYNQLVATINNNKLYICKKLPVNCRASYIINCKNYYESENVLPIKLFIEKKSQRWHLWTQQYCIDTETSDSNIELEILLGKCKNKHYT